MTEPAPVSAFIICKNEIAVLGDCIESVGFCNDIVIVDSGSTDGTLELIASYREKGFPIRLFQREWPGYAKQKQFALDQARGPWCLGLDADERADTALRERLRNLPEGQGGPVAYMIAKRDYLPGYGYPPAIVHARKMLRLVRKGRARYDESLAVHEKLIPDGALTDLDRGVILHFRNISIAEEMRKNDAYSSLKARERAGRGKSAGLASVIFKPLAQFLKFYVVQRYLVCGTAGFIYAAMMAQYAFSTEAKLYRLNLGANSPDAQDGN